MLSQINDSFPSRRLLLDNPFPTDNRSLVLVDSVIHVATVNVGPENAGRVEMLPKSILLFHEGTIHIHVLSDARYFRDFSIVFE